MRMQNTEEALYRGQFTKAMGRGELFEGQIV